jgi:hypothetical protein
MSRISDPRRRAATIDRASIATIESLESRRLLTVIFSEDFEGPFPGAWVVTDENGEDRLWGDNRAKFVSGQKSAFAADNGNDFRQEYDNFLWTTMQRRDLDLRGYQSLILTFEYWMNIEEDFDFFEVHIEDQIGSFTRVLQRTGSSNGWQTASIDLSQFRGQNGVDIHFEFKSDDSVVEPAPSGVWVDDVVLLADETGDPPPQIFPNGEWLWANQFGDLAHNDDISSASDYDIFAYMPEVAGSHNFSTGTGIDTQLRLYDNTGAAITDLVDEGFEGETIIRNLSAGQWYYIAVSGYQATTGDYTLSINGPDATALPIATPPPNHSATVDDSLNHGGDIEWFSVFTPADNPNLDLLLTPELDLDGRIEVYDSAGTRLNFMDNDGDGGPESLAGAVVEGQTYWIAILGATRSSFGGFQLALDFGLPASGDPPDTVPSGTPISWVWGNPFGDIQQFDSIDTSVEVDFLTFNPEVSGNYLFSTTGTLDTQLRLYNASGQAITPVIDNNSGAGGANGNEAHTASLTGGQWYYLAVAGAGAHVDDYDLLIDGPSPTHATMVISPPTYFGNDDAQIDYGGDRYFYVLEIPQGADTLNIKVSPGFGLGPLDSYVEVYDSEGGFWDIVDSPGDGAVDEAAVDLEGIGGTVLYLAIGANDSQQFSNFDIEVDFEPDNIGSIQGRKWLDLDSDGVADDGESGMAGWTIFADLDDDGTHDIGEPFAITDETGGYEIAGLAPGTYRVVEVLVPGWLQTFPGANGANGFAAQSPAMTMGGRFQKRRRFEDGVEANFVPSGTKWPQPGGIGSPITLTYSYSNLLDGGLTGLTPAQLKSAIEEALALWSRFAPITFIEIPDIGPHPETGGAGDEFYLDDSAALLRFGHHFIDGDSFTLAHAFTPPPNGGSLAGDIHFDNGETWSLGSSFDSVDFLETAVHEIGHALGLTHEPEPPDGNEAIMNAFLGNRYSGLGTAFLYPDDINGIQSLYGAADPRPGTWLVTVLAGQAAEDINFGNFPTVFNGGDDEDHFTLRVDPTNPNRIEIFHSFPISTRYTIDRAMLPSLTFDLGEGNDLLIFEFTDGNPIPAGGVEFNGGDGSDSFVISDGAYTLNIDLASRSFESAGVESGGELTFAVSQHLSSLGVADSSAAKVAPSASFLRVGSLQLFGTLDLTDNALIFDGGNLDSVTGMIQSNTLLSSSNIANRRLGAIRNIGRTSFAGESGLDGDEILVLYTLIGDVNLDQQVSIADFIVLASHFNQTPATWGDGDLNYDGAVTIADFIALASNFNSSFSGQSDPEALAAQAAMAEWMEQHIPGKKKKQKLRKVRHHRARPAIVRPALPQPALVNRAAAAAFFAPGRR